MRRTAVRRLSGVRQLAAEAGGAVGARDADDARLEPYATDAHAAVLASAIGMRQPAAVLVPSTAMGRDLAPRVAARLGLGYHLAGLEALTNLVGPSRAKEMFFTARRFRAEEALMKEASYDEDEFSTHAREHQIFTDQIVMFADRRDDESRTLHKEKRPRAFFPGVRHMKGARHVLPS